MLPVRRAARAAAAARRRCASARRARGSTRSIYGMIAERRAAAGDRGDLLSMLLAGAGRRGRRRRDDRPAGARRGDDDLPRRPRDDGERADVDVVSAVSSTPDVEARAARRRSIASLGGRAADAEDLARAARTLERCSTESMRLYPPAWIVGRRALGRYPIGGYVLPARLDRAREPVRACSATRAASPIPSGSTRSAGRRSAEAALPKFAYFPFGGGPRQCIGESFAWMERVLVLATIAQRWRLRLVPGQVGLLPPSPCGRAGRSRCGWSGARERSRPLRARPDRLAPPRRSAVRGREPPFRRRARRDDAAPHRRHRPRAERPGRGAGDPRRPRMARRPLGGGARYGRASGASATGRPPPCSAGASAA